MGKIKINRASIYDLCAQVAGLQRQKQHNRVFWKWNKRKRHFEQKRNLVTKPIGPASEPVVVGQPLDRPHGSDCDVLHKKQGMNAI